MEPRAVRYSRTFFYLRALLLLILFAAVILFLALQTLTPAAWVGLLAALLAAYLIVVGLSPLLTSHTLTQSRLILRQGWYFRAVVPFGDVESIGPYDGALKYGLRLSLAKRILFVVGSAQNLVAVRLREPRRLPQILFMRAEEVVFDVDNRDAFLAEVEERHAMPEPLPARKIPLLPTRR